MVESLTRKYGKAWGRNRLLTELRMLLSIRCLLNYLSNGKASRRWVYKSRIQKKNVKNRVKDLVTNGKWV